MSPQRWLDRSQPVSLQRAVMLAYFLSAFAVFDALISGGPSLVGIIILAAGVGAIGIANEKRWGYWLAVVGSGLYVLGQLTLLPFVLAAPLLVINLLFGVALLVLLLHPMSRSYQKIWFH
jgi:hypothetical protein